MGQSEPKQRRPGRCPVCGAPSEVAVRPFCTSRCANVDLLRWLRGGYVIEGRVDEEEDGAAADADTGQQQVSHDRQGARHEDE